LAEAADSAAVDPAAFTVPTGAFPNMLNSIAIKGTHAYVPNNAASPIAKFGQASQYFRLSSFITVGSTQFSLYSLLYRDNTGAVRPIQRSFTPD